MDKENRGDTDDGRYGKFLKRRRRGFELEEGDVKVLEL